jgi:hypothetical protein
MPGYSMPDFRCNAVTMVVGGIYDIRQHIGDVVMPVLGKWRIFERDDFSGQGAKRREELAVVLQRLKCEARKFEESKARLPGTRRPKGCNENRLIATTPTRCARRLAVGFSATSAY